MDIREQTSFFIGEWQVSPHEDTLSQDGNTVRLEPRAMEVLVYLASRPGEVVSRRDLENSVWTGMVVTDDAVTSAIIKLRKALGDNAKDPRFIATVPKRGYQLIAPVTKPAAGADEVAVVDRGRDTNRIAQGRSGQSGPDGHDTRGGGGPGVGLAEQHDPRSSRNPPRQVWMKPPARRSPSWYCLSKT